MFTGIIEVIGQISRIVRQDEGIVLDVVTPNNWSSIDLRVGDSVAVNGVCLTITDPINKVIRFFVQGQTLKVSNLGDLDKTKAVNLESALRMNDFLGGHIVQGHVDGVCKILDIVNLGQGHRLCLTRPAFAKAMIDKGSVTLNGISLTISELTKDSFYTDIIPHTWNVTSMNSWKVGDSVNVELDMMGKYIHSYLSQMNNQD